MYLSNVRKKLNKILTRGVGGNLLKNCQDNSKDAQLALCDLTAYESMSREEEDLTRFINTYRAAGVEVKIDSSECDDRGNLTQCTLLIRRVGGVIPQGNKFFVITDYFNNLDGKYMHTTWKEV